MKNKLKQNSYLKFFKKSAIFIVGLVIITFFLEFAINFLVKQINVGEYGVFNKINNGKINADILISGSSRALKALNPEIIEKETGLRCFNIASDGSDLGLQLPKFKWYLNHNKKPKILIQDISQFGGDISNSIYEPFKYLPYLSDDSLYNGILKIDNEYWKHKYLPPANLIYYNFDFYSKLSFELLMTIKGKDKFINGFLPDNSKWSGEFNLYKQQHLEGINCAIPEDYKNYLNEIKNLCIENQITLLLVVLPNYYRLREISINIDDVFNYYKSLESGSNCYLLDYSNNEISRNEKFLYNFTHLNLDGAKLLSTNLAFDMKNLNIFNY